MQIKVKDTRMQEVTYFNNKLNLGTKDTVPVTEAKLVLVEYYAESNNEIREYWKDVTPKTGALPTWRPILISETEKIEAGDWRYSIVNQTIALAGEVMKAGEFGMYKILALPEHFSPKHLQAIVDGKIKDSDEVLVECIQLEWKDMEPPYSLKYGIKLNSSNHITLHKIEEKMYTREEMEKCFDAGFERGRYVENGEGFSYHTPPTKIEWFEQNVK